MLDQHDKIKELETASILPLLVKYSLPAIAGMVVFAIYNVVDSIFVGQWIGKAGLAGIAIAFPITTITFAIGTLIGLGGAARLSIRLGEKKYELASRVLGNVVFMGPVLGVLFGWTMSLFFLPHILHLFGTDAETFEPAYEFTRVMLLGSPITYLFFNQNHLMRASGFPGKAMCSMILSVGVNVILAPIFIKILGWGMYGTALATMCAQTVGLVWVLAHFCGKDRIVRFRRGIFRPRWYVIKSIFSIGLAPCLMNICACIVVLVINRALLQFGGNSAIAAYGILNRILIVSGMTVIGITQGMQPIIGYNHGAGNRDRVLKTLRYGVTAGTAISTFFAAFCVIFPQLISCLFTSDESLHAVTNEALRFSTIALPFVGGPMVLGNFYQAIGRAKLSIFLSVTRQMLFLIPLLLILPRFWGTMGVWLSMPIADTITFVVNIFLIISFLRGYQIKPADVAGAKARAIYAANHGEK